MNKSDESSEVNLPIGKKASPPKGGSGKVGADRTQKVEQEIRSPTPGVYEGVYASGLGETPYGKGALEAFRKAREQELAPGQWLDVDTEYGTYRIEAGAEAGTLFNRAKPIRCSQCGGSMVSTWTGKCFQCANPTPRQDHLELQVPESDRKKVIKRLEVVSLPPGESIVIGLNNGSNYLVYRENVGPLRYVIIPHTPGGTLSGFEESPVPQAKPNTMLQLKTWHCPKCQENFDCQGQPSPCLNRVGEGDLTRQCGEKLVEGRAPQLKAGEVPAISGVSGVVAIKIPKFTIDKDIKYAIEELSKSCRGLSASAEQAVQKVTELASAAQMVGMSFPGRGTTSDYQAEEFDFEKATAEMQGRMIDEINKRSFEMLTKVITIPNGPTWNKMPDTIAAQVALMHRNLAERILPKGFDWAMKKLPVRKQDYGPNASEENPALKMDRIVQYEIVHKPFTAEIKLEDVGKIMATPKTKPSRLSISISTKITDEALRCLIFYLRIVQSRKVKDYKFVDPRKEGDFNKMSSEEKAHLDAVINTFNPYKYSTLEGLELDLVARQQVIYPLQVQEETLETPLPHILIDWDISPEAVKYIYGLLRSIKSPEKDQGGSFRGSLWSRITSEEKNKIERAWLQADPNTFQDPQCAVLKNTKGETIYPRLEATMSETPKTKMQQFIDKVSPDVQAAGIRVLGKQVTKTVEEPITALLLRGLPEGKNSPELRARIAKGFASDTGRGFLQSILGGGVLLIPGEHPFLDKLGSELRQEGFSEVANQIAELIAEPMRQIIVDLIKKGVVVPVGLPSESSRTKVDVQVEVLKPQEVGSLK